jgi:hypothetical protein
MYSHSDKDLNNKDAMFEFGFGDVMRMEFNGKTM